MRVGISGGVYLHVHITQAGSGEESEEEEDDSDGEEGPRGRMCTQS